MDATDYRAGDFTLHGLTGQELLWLELAMRRLIIETERKGDNAEPFKILQDKLNCEIDAWMGR